MRRIVQAKTTGFALDVTVTDPNGLSSGVIQALSSDIHQILDPETGLAVSGRHATVQLAISTLRAAGFIGELPRNIQDSSSKPWLVEFEDLEGARQVFKVNQGNPDRSLGLINCVLEVYRPLT